MRPSGAYASVYTAGGDGATGVQGGADPLGASTSKAKFIKALDPEMVAYDLSDEQKNTAKALYRLGKVGPKAACRLAVRFKSLGQLVRFFQTTPRAAAIAEIEGLKQAASGTGGRNVGPCAARHLHRFFTTDDAEAAYEIAGK